MRHAFFLCATSKIRDRKWTSNLGEALRGSVDSPDPPGYWLADRGALLAGVDELSCWYLKQREDTYRRGIKPRKLGNSCGRMWQHAKLTTIMAGSKQRSW